MSKIFYIGLDEQVYGPVSESEVQAWYACGYLTSDIKFQISASDQFDPNEQLFSLAELIDLNGRSLPFYFSAEKSDQERRKEDSLNQLKEEMASLRSSLQDKQQNDQTEERKQREENEAIGVLKTQVSLIVKSHSEILQKLNSLSSKKESSPEIPQLEKRMVEMKKKVDEHENSLASMKKEISAVNSKCDRNESKLDKLIEKEKETEWSVNGCNRKIKELKSSEKEVRDSINSCEQNVESTSSQLQSITGDLIDMKTVMKNLKNESVEHGLMIDCVTSDVTELISTVERHDKQMKTVAAPQDPITIISADRETIQPWDREKEKIFRGLHQDEAGKTTEPWNVKKDEEMNGPVGEEKCMNSGIATSVAQKDETSEVSSAKNVKVVDAKPVPRKNWEAICRELSDDDEEPDEPKVVIIQASRKELTEVIMGNFINLLRVFCEAIELANADYLKMRRFLFDFDKITQSLVTTCDVTVLFLAVCDNVYCAICHFSITFPHHLMNHLIEDNHIQNTKKWFQETDKWFDIEKEEIAELGQEFDEWSRLVQGILSHFIAAFNNDSMEKEARLHEKGKRLDASHKKKSRYRPRTSFINKIATEIIGKMPVFFKGRTKVTGTLNGAPIVTLNHGESGPFLRELAANIREWLKIENNRGKIAADFDKELSGKIPACGNCKEAFDNIDEYFLHMTSYKHASLDQSSFTMFMSIWKSGDY